MILDSRIPVHAKKVFSGLRTDIYQWQQELYDGSIVTFERGRYIDGAFAIAITPEHKILVTEQEQPASDGIFLSLPGGAFDYPDEEPLLCAQRELLEETGYMSNDWELYYVANGTQNTIVYTYFYIARHVTKTREPSLDPGEKIVLREYDFDAFLLLSEDLRFIHLSLVRHLFMARLSPDFRAEMEKTFFR